MSHDQAVEIYEEFSKDPANDDLTYYEVKALLGDGSIYEPMGLPWKALSYGSQWGLPDGEPLHPVTVDRVNLAIGVIRDILAVQTPEELQTLFDAIDKDANGEVTHEEVCRHYVNDSEFICVTYIQPETISVIKPDYKPSSPQ